MKKILLGLILIFILGCSDKTDKNGFYIEGENTGTHKETNTPFNKNGYDISGYDKNGYDVYGYNKNGWSKENINKETSTLFDKNGYDIFGYDENGWSKENINKETNTLFDENGYDIFGYDENGWSKKRIHKETNEFYNKNGFNKGGFTRYGFNKKNEFEKEKFYNYKFEESEFSYQNTPQYINTQAFLFKGLKDIFLKKYSLEDLKKGEFETTLEFKERKNTLQKKYLKEIEDIKNEYYIVYTNDFINGRYNADNEEWLFTKTFEMTDGSFNKRYVRIDFNTPIYINLKVKMPISEAKLKKSGKVAVRFLVTDTTDNYPFPKAKVVAYQIYTIFENKQNLIKEVYID